MEQPPWLELESVAVSQQLNRMVEKIVKRHKKRLPASAYNLRKAAGRIGGKLARSSVPLGGSTRRLLDRAKALHAAHFVLRRLRDIQRLNRDLEPEIMASVEVTERLIDLIRIGK